MRDDVLRSELTGLTPRLRRYARALTNGAAGASELADDLVHATLMRALGARHIGGMSELLIRLYATVTQLHREIGVSGQQARAAVAGSPVLITTAPRPPATRQTHLSSGLLGLPLEAREALLLVGLEGFDYAEAARILRISRSVLIGRLTQARTALDAALRMDTCRNDVGQVGHGELRQGNGIHKGTGQVVHASEPGNRQRRPRAPYLRLVT